MVLEYKKADKTFKEFVYNEFVKMVYDYEDLNLIDINEVQRWEKSKLTKNIKNYTLVYNEDVFMGCFWLKEEENHFELDDFYIKKERRNQGIGSVVLGKCIDTARKNKKALQLTVFKKNIGAIRFYERYGFSILEDLGTKLKMTLR